MGRKVGGGVCRFLVFESRREFRREVVVLIVIDNSWLVIFRRLAMDGYVFIVCAFVYYLNFTLNRKFCEGGISAFNLL